MAVLGVLTLFLAPLRASSETNRDRRASESAKARWEISKFPPQIREQIFLTAASVPVFPVNDPRLLKPKTWPETMVIGGVLCARRIHGRDGDDAFALKTAEGVEPGVQLTLFYDHQGSKWNSGNAGWGPQYSWNQEKRLTQRIWYEPDSTRLSRKDYTYYKDGSLLGYSWRNEPRNQRSSTRHHEFLSQFFDEDGRLIAVCYEKMTPGARDSMYAWAGAEVPYDNFRMKCHNLYSTAHPGER
jgi:hypothetical protein